MMTCAALPSEREKIAASAGGGAMETAMKLAATAGIPA
jgi:hypothetical protein